MFCVFHKGQFKGNWHNTHEDKGWLARTCDAMAWNPNDVEAYSYGYIFHNESNYIFDENKNLLIQGKKIENEVEVFGTVETWPGTKYVENS